MCTMTTWWFYVYGMMWWASSWPGALSFLLLILPLCKVFSLLLLLLFFNANLSKPIRVELFNGLISALV